MAEADKLNIDSIIQRLLEGKPPCFARYLFTEVAILANSANTTITSSAMSAS